MTDRTMARHMAEAIRIKEEIGKLEEELNKHQDAIKAEMHERAVDTLELSGHKATYKEVTSSRFDSKSFQKVHKALYDSFRKPSVSMRFTLV